MKTKIIKSIISNRIKHWIDSIEDKNLQKLLKENTIVSGGCIVSFLLNEEVNDYDIYFRNKKTALAVAKYYVNIWNIKHNSNIKVYDSSEQDYYENYYLEENPHDKENQHDRVRISIKSRGFVGKPVRNEFKESIDENTSSEQKTSKNYKPVFITDNAISLSNKIQLIIRFYGEPNVIHENYDFEHCKCYYDYYTKELSTPELSLLSIINKELFYTGSKYPICSVIRTRKFLNRGWKINAGQYLKMCFQISDLDLTDIDVLRDQLIGVDAAYFNEVIDELIEFQKNSKSNFDAAYFNKVIDKIF